MVIKEKLGNLATFRDEGRAIDRLPLEWYETRKRILHKRTGSGKEITLKFLAEAQYLQQDDVLYADEKCIVVVEVLATDAIVLRPASLYQVAYAAYEIGNKHLPLFFEEDCLLLPFEAPVYRQLQAAGFEPLTQKRKLLHPLRTTVLPHTHPGENRESFFSKILKLTAPSND
ncbi:urease accessory protein UreE [Flavisolibacter nicotianae]|uniref:urease accessory protein UreE n=1 Tax=Flavisolibacter nicotianae TaxID=2364882 RepID=UPI000EAE1E7B|nr:urease accessory protein UreE [Flavisolibacter nicotianae]